MPHTTNARPERPKPVFTAELQTTVRAPERAELRSLTLHCTSFPIDDPRTEDRIRHMYYFVSASITIFDGRIFASVNKAHPLPPYYTFHAGNPLRPTLLVQTGNTYLSASELLEGVRLADVDRSDAPLLDVLRAFPPGTSCILDWH